jgi:hypothetical protein
MTEHNENESQIMLARLDERVVSMQREIHVLRGLLEEYITRHEFWPTKVISLGLAGLLLSAVVAAIIAQVLK